MLNNKLFKSMFLAAAGATALGLAGAAQAVVISNGGTLFSDTFDNDTLGALPTLSGGDIGSGYTQVSGTVANTDVVDDGSSNTIPSRTGRYLNIANDGAENGRIVLNVAAQNAGTVSASYSAYISGSSSGGSSLRMAFTTAAGFKSSIHSAYLVNGTWFTDQAGGTLPLGTDGDDLFVAYFPGGSYQLATIGGNTWSLADGQDQWVDVTLSQSAGTGGNPFLTINGQALDAIPLAGSADAITGLEFGSNGGGDAQAYVDAIPEPASIALLGLGGLLMLRRRKSVA